ncbi:hypothetical protein CPC08DRAFT_721931 [Agrocybe pediades]|nr:hypothetical protein CPC08DRAFT_721931 [Agrocybe pediades]
MLEIFINPVTAKTCLGVPWAAHKAQGAVSLLRQFFDQYWTSNYHKEPAANDFYLGKYLENITSEIKGSEKISFHLRQKVLRAMQGYVTSRDESNYSTILVESFGDVLKVQVEAVESFSHRNLSTDVSLSIVAKIVLNNKHQSAPAPMSDWIIGLL